VGAPASRTNQKNGRATLVDYTILDQLLDALPTAADVKADD
jgi:hypothetical protein